MHCRQLKQRRNTANERRRILRYFSQHPWTKYNQSRYRGNQLRHKCQRHLLDLSNDLENTDDYADKKNDAKNWCCDQNTGPQHFPYQLEREIAAHFYSPYCFIGLNETSTVKCAPIFQLPIDLIITSSAQNEALLILVLRAPNKMPLAELRLLAVLLTYLRRRALPNLFSLGNLKQKGEHNDLVL